MKITENVLQLGSLKLDFPAVRVKIGKQIFEPSNPGERAGNNSWIFRSGVLTFHVALEMVTPNVLRKKIRIESSKKLATPDWVETDRQCVPDGKVERCGYRATTSATGRPGAEEEGGGLKPGCGYPLIGKHFFAGSEHPATFGTVEKQTKAKATYCLVQHPVWSDDNVIECAGVVCSWSDDPRNAFFDYLDAIRIPALTSPKFSLCSFWSDPYLGNYEYLIAPGNYKSFIDAFSSMGIVPDLYTLDAGWQNRKSIFEPKDSFHGNAGLWKLEKYIRKQGSRLGLWVCHNGPMGYDPEYLKSLGIEIGAGESSTYCGSNYGVLMDKKLEKVVGDRWVELAKAGVMQFKMDWDNDCATNKKFAKKFPTRDHVREESINAMIRIAHRIHKANEGLVMRSGWWPSPWWLMHIHHIFLPDSGDSEYTTLPSRTQRDSAATYRDTMYYSCFQRDKSAFPLDAVDNHEFPHALRNPFHELPACSADTAMMAIMRGTSYLPLTLQPEALEPWHAEILKKVMAFARAYGKQWYASRSTMFGGNPNAGAIYGYRFEQKDGTCWCALRNPSPMPQTFNWRDEKRDGVWIYPCFARFNAGKTIIFAPHEVKVILLSCKQLALPYEQPFQAEINAEGKTEFRFPAHLEINSTVKPMVGEIYQLPGTEIEWQECKAIENGFKLLFKVRLPYRMREMTLNITAAALNAEVEVRQSRYATADGSCVDLPVTKLREGVPGAGERYNPDLVVPCKESFFTAPLAEGGEAWYGLFVTGIKSLKQLKLSLSGFYAPSRNAITCKWIPAWLGKTLPPVHPVGFPMAEMIDLPKK